MLKNIVKKLIPLACIVLLIAACQPTPDKEAVINKGDIDLQEKIQKTAEPFEAAKQTENLEKKWTYEKDYDSGNRLIVDAVMYNTDADKLPVLSVAPKLFESGEQQRKITGVFCPDSDAKIYDQGDKATKQQLEQAIMDVRNEIFNVENNLPPYPGADPIPEENKEHYIEGLKDAIAYYEQQLPDAPDESELKEASYQLDDKGSSFQSNMIAEMDDAVIYIDFVNWDIGSDFWLKSSLFNEQNVGTYARNVLPAFLEDDTEFLKARTKAEQYVAEMGIDYMSVSSVSKGERSYSFYYTRTYNGLQETYVGGFIGTTTTAVDYGPAIFLWDPEYLYMEIQDGRAVKVEWHNSTEITNVDNENVQTKPWEEIQEIFKTQMDYLLTPEPISKGNQSSVFFEETEVHINSIELGLTKILMKDSKDDYKLIPTWNFMGHETGALFPAEEGIIYGAVKCFITINAIDGTIIDRGLMY
jgi:uncharacterized protein (DUF2164 family)